MAKEESLVKLLGNKTQDFVHLLRNEYPYLVSVLGTESLLGHTPFDLSLWALDQQGGVNVPEDLSKLGSEDFNWILSSFLATLGGEEAQVLRLELAEQGWIA